MKHLYTLALCIIILPMFAQESKKGATIYLVNGNGISAKVITVEDEKVVFSTEESVTKTYSIERIPIAFNEAGNYLIISQISKDKNQAQQQISDFYNQTSERKSTNDIIFKAVPFEVIPCTITYNKEAINYRTIDGNSASINKDNILAIIYLDGSHEIVRDISEVVPVLADNYGTFNRLRSAKAKSNPVKSTFKEPTIVLKSTPITTPEVPTKNAEPMVPVSTAKTESDPILKGNKPKLTEAEKIIYKTKSIDKVVEFKDYLNVIANKKRSPSEKSDAISNALKLFTPGATIEVTSKIRHTSKKLPVDVYLKNLSNLNYSSVDIEYANLRLISEFNQAEDGNYYGIVSGEQTFMGYGSSGRPQYSDVVNKNYKVKLEAYQKTVDGKEQNKWNILFGDVTVSQ